MAVPRPPVLILALDTTTRAGSTAVLRHHDVLALVPGDGRRTHGERLPGELDRALADAGCTLADVDLLAVASGPGAFTGLRIGLAAIQGLALVLGTPVVGVSALAALAAAAVDAPPAEVGRVGTWMDAARGEVFAALYDAAAAPDGGVPHLQEVEPPAVGLPEAILRAWMPHLASPILFAGDGAQRYAAAIEDTARAGQAAGRVVDTPLLAGWIGRLAVDQASRGLAGPPHALQPLYVRRPDVEIVRGRRQP